MHEIAVHGIFIEIKSHLHQAGCLVGTYSRSSRSYSTSSANKPMSTLRVFPPAVTSRMLLKYEKSYRRRAVSATPATGPLPRGGRGSQNLRYTSHNSRVGCRVSISLRCADLRSPRAAERPAPQSARSDPQAPHAHENALQMNNSPMMAMHAPAPRCMCIIASPQCRTPSSRPPTRTAGCFSSLAPLSATSPGRTQTTFSTTRITPACGSNHLTRRSHFGHDRRVTTITQVLRADGPRCCSISTQATLAAADLTLARAGRDLAGTSLTGHFAQLTAITLRGPAHRCRIELHQGHRRLGVSLGHPT